MPYDRPNRHDDNARPDYKTIRVEPLTPTIGAEIAGVDLGQPLTELQFDEIHTTLMRHAVIFFRDQQLTIEQHKAFGRRFGELDIHPTSRMAGHPEVIEIKADENSQYIAGEVWHSDVTASPTPPMGSILYMHQTPDNGGGDTLFVNMYRAYETLAEPVRKMIDGMTAIHDGDRVWRGRQKKKNRRGRAAALGASGGAHPPCHRPPRALRQPQLHRMHRRRIAARKRCHSRHAVSPLRARRL